MRRLKQLIAAPCRNRNVARSLMGEVGEAWHAE